MKIGIYVGSFNPVHKAHTKIINYLLNNNYLDKIIIIPTSNYWDKKDIIDVQFRIDMFRFYENSQLLINDKLNDIPFTYQILEQLKKEYPNDNLILIIGADNLPKFHLWKEVNQILTNQIIVIPRDDIEIINYVNQFEQKDRFIIIDNFENLNISSTDIRKKINNNESDNLLDLIDIKVLNYINENNLYK